MLRSFLLFLYYLLGNAILLTPSEGYFQVVEIEEQEIYGE